MPGKVDWMARGLLLEGDKARAPRAIDFARQDVVTCDLDTPVAEVRERVHESPFGFAFVVHDDVLLGRLRKAALEGHDATRAESVMEPGPSTTRPDTDPHKLRAKLEDADLTTAVLTDPEGRLLGIVRRNDLPAAAT
ncbi:MAG TPA: CBS domain-containing protein [Solirubrobacteraceae bacterium]|nr:CBS domain-containing protein [Solirubrobacteraceae bacterium]